MSGIDAKPKGPELWEPRPIVFQMRMLPLYANALDQLSKEWANLPEETADWFWRFSICVGRTRSSKSAEVIEHAKRGFDVLQADPQRAAERIHEAIPHHDGMAIVQSLMESLTIICELAQLVDECEWMSPLLPEDAQYLQNERAAAKRMLEALDRWRNDALGEG